MTRFRSTVPAWLLGLVLFLPAAPARGELLIHVSLDTTALEADAADEPFAVVFDLIGNGNTTAVLDNFDFGGGSAGSVVSTIGGASGDLASAVTLTESAPFVNEFVQHFDPGATLSFSLSLTTSAAGMFPDSFSFAIEDKNGVTIPTHDAIGTDNLLAVNVATDTTSSDISTYGGDTSRTTSSGATLDVGPPGAGIVPEPATLLPAIVALALGGVLRQRNRRWRRADGSPTVNRS